MRSETAESPRIKSWFTKFFATLITAMLSSAALLLATPAAHADQPGFSTTVLHNGSPLADGAVVAPGDTFTFNTQYTPEVGDGTEVVLGVPEGVSVPESALVVPDGNTAIESITQNADGDIVITFVDPFPTDVQEGVHAINLTFDEVEYTESRTIEWTVAGTPYTRDIVVQHPDEESVSNWTSKQRGGGNLYANYVSVDADGNVQLSDDLVDYKIPYTLTVHTDRNTDRSEFSIEDSFDNDYLAYNDDFSATITQWDENGLNPYDEDFEFDPTIEGNSFSGTVNIPGPSELTINYTASVSSDQVDALRDDLQAQYDAFDGPYGSFVLELGNTAIMGGAEENAQINIGTTVDAPEGPGIGEAFGKSANWSSQNIVPAEDGTLDPPLDVTYTFNADLSAWDGRDDVPNPEDFVLDRNVVISDELYTQGEWNTADDEFITADGIELTEATGFDGSAAQFAADEYVGQYAVVGQYLYINIGQSSDTDVAISAKALINTIDGLNNNPVWGTDFVEYYFDNDAWFAYSDDEEPYEDSAGINLIDRGDTSEGVNLPQVFSKTTDTEDPLYVGQGDTATIDYEFVVNGWGEESVDVTNSYIVDERDPNVFDLSDLEEIRAGITGQYDWWIDLGPEHFDVSTNDEGNLVIALNDAGVEEAHRSDRGVDSNLVVNIPLTTYPLTGKQTITVENSATLYGADDEALYWSETTSEASSYGSESELRKTVRDTPNAEWTQNLRVEIGEDGELVQDHYVYNLAYIAHGSFTNLPSIEAAHDQLPDNLEFVGFVTDDNVDSGENPTREPVDIGGNLQAFYDDDDHTVTIHLPEGELLQSVEGMSANVLVRVVDFDENVPVANVFGNSTTIITPSDGYPLSIAKVDSEDQEVVINDPDSRFQILDAEDNVVIEDAFVENGQLRALDAEGDVTGLVVSEPGTYYVEETVAPAGYELSDQRIQVTVDEDGSSSQVTFPNVPAEAPEDPEPAVEIIKGDGDAEAGTIANDANTEDDAVAYEDGETRDIVITVENTGTEELVDVVLTDQTQSGSDIENLVWTLPNGETVEASANDDGVLTASWDGPWAVGDTITGTATLTLGAGEELHTNLASVDAVGAGSGTEVSDDDPYNATPPEDPPVPGIELDKHEPGDDEHVVEAGTHEFEVTFTNSGNEALENFTWTDTTESGQDAQFNADDIAGLEGLVLEVGESYTIRGSVEVAAGETHRDNFVVNADGVISGESVTDEDPTTFEVPETPSVSVGDFVWLDEDADGIQDDGEPGIPGVVLEITGPDGDPVTDVNGDPVGSVTTDEDGFYTFEDLPVLEEGQSYTVTIDQDASEEALDGYEPTLENEGDDPAVDSSTWTATSTGLTEDGDRDPTLDFGFIVTPEPEPTPDPEDPTYAIGDYVWIDENGNGVQDEDEDPLSGVKVVLYDGEGNEIADTTTDENGRYIFDNLPAGEYQVGFELTEEQAEIYTFTGYTQGEDSAQDSNAGDNGRSVVFTLGPDSPLVSDGDYEYNTVEASEGIDPTWDAGVILIPEDETPPPTETPTPTPEPSDGPSDPSDPQDPQEETPEDKEGELSSTGANFALMFGALGLLLLVTGGLLYARHRNGNEA